MSRYWVYHKLYDNIWVIKRRFIILGELDKIYHMFSNSIDCELISQGGIRFEKNFKSYSNNQWL
jgi:hypothetical protein